MDQKSGGYTQYLSIKWECDEKWWDFVSCCIAIGWKILTRWCCVPSWKMDIRATQCDVKHLGGIPAISCVRTSTLTPNRCDWCAIQSFVSSDVHVKLGGKHFDENIKTYQDDWTWPVFRDAMGHVIRAEVAKTVRIVDWTSPWVDVCHWYRGELRGRIAKKGQEIIRFKTKWTGISWVIISNLLPFH